MKKKVGELLTSEARWCRGALARTRSGAPCDPTSFEAVRWSLSGAICRCYPPEEAAEIRRKLRAKLSCAVVSWWDDNGTTTWAKVKAVIEELGL